VSEITRALWITLAGMGLTFLGIFAIWGMMGLTVRWFRDRSQDGLELEETAFDAPGDLPVEPEPKPGIPLKAIAVAIAVAKALELRKQVAAAAVSVALSSPTPVQPGQPVEISHAWQIVHRMSQINQRNQAFNRKPRGE
jgi:hypothetical protein